MSSTSEGICNCTKSGNSSAVALLGVESAANCGNDSLTAGEQSYWRLSSLTIEKRTDSNIVSTHMLFEPVSFAFALRTAAATV